MSSASWLSRVFCYCWECQSVAGNQRGSSYVNLNTESSSNMEKIEVVDSEEQVVHALVHYVEEKSKAAIAERDRFVMGLSGVYHNLFTVFKK